MSMVPPPGHNGRIELIIGSMFASKTTEMIDRIHRATLTNRASVIIKFHGDSRYDNGAIVTTHAGIRQISTPETKSLAPVRIVIASCLSEVDVSEPVIGIDEGQFFPDLVECCERWAAKGHCVIVAALDGDFARRPFGQVCSLIPLCESVEKRRGICMVCRSRDSAFTQRIGASTNLVEIGAQESYRSVCRQCYSLP